MLLLSPAGIRDADRPGQGYPPLADHTEHGYLKLLAQEFLRRVQEFLASGWGGAALVVTQSLMSLRDTREA
jgi:hypothetical protein